MSRLETISVNEHISASRLDGIWRLLSIVKGQHEAGPLLLVDWVSEAATDYAYLLATDVLSFHVSVLNAESLRDNVRSRGDQVEGLRRAHISVPLIVHHVQL